MSGIGGMWHSTAMVAHYDSVLDPLQRIFGAVVMHDQESHEPAVGRRGGMVWVGDNSIEVGAPLGEQSPVRRFVDEWGGGMHSLALRIDDARETLDRLSEVGVSPIAFVSDEIYFTSPRDTEGLLLEWSATHTDDDPRWGYPLGDPPAPPLLDVEEYAFVTAVVPDPVATAQRLAQVLGTDVVSERADARPDQIGAAVSLVDCLLLLFPLAGSGGADLWGGTVGRGRFHGHGLRVADLDAARSTLEAAGIDPGRTVEGMVLLDAAVAGVPTFVCEELLPEDPRR